jgi:hypothetical protein
LSSGENRRPKSVCIVLIYLEALYFIFKVMITG